MTDAVDSVAWQGALATLLAVRASVKGGESVQRFLIGDQKVPLNTEGAARLLANLPKPVTCEAGLAEPDLLAIQCTPRDPGEPLWFDPGQVILPEVARGANDATILFKAAGESLILSRATLNRWVRDYYIARPRSIWGNDPTVEERASSVVWVLGLGQGGIFTATSVDDLDIPDEDTKASIAEAFRRAQAGLPIFEDEDEGH